MITTLALLAATVLAPVHMAVVAYTPDGDAWIAGRGDTCASAWKDAVLPADTVYTVCVEERGS